MISISNYHTHTELCKHAKGRPVDYVKQAIKENCLELGFSDHCPYSETFVSQDIWEEIRMAKNEMSLYKQMIEDAKAIAPFPVYMGFECEWDKRYESWYRDELLGNFGADYLILGPHWLSTGSEHIYCKNLKDKKQLMNYTDQMIQGMASGLFKFVAHPDLFMFGYAEWDDFVKSLLKAILDAAINLNLPLEVNGLGTTREPNKTERGMRYAYPYVEFWEMVADSKAKVVCNSDAHNPLDVIMNAWRARDFASRFGIKPLDKIQMN